MGFFIDILCAILFIFVSWMYIFFMVYYVYNIKLNNFAH